MRFLVISQHRRLYGTRRCGYGLRRTDGIEDEDDGMVASQPASTRRLLQQQACTPNTSVVRLHQTFGLHCQPIT